MIDRLNPQSAIRAIMAATLLGAGFSLGGCATTNGLDLSELGPVNPAPAPTPAATASLGPVTQPTLGTSPLPVSTPADKIAIEDAAADTTLSLRLTQSARTISAGPPMTTASDATTDAGGATIAFDVPVDPNAEATVRFSIGNAALGVNNVTLGDPDPSGTMKATLGDGRIVSVYLDTADKNTASDGDELEWTGYGNWAIRSAANVTQNASSFVTGYETPNSAMPTSGTATFNGFVQGSVTKPDGANIASAALQGDASLTANFATGTISGSAPSVMAIIPGSGTEAWNGLTFAGTFATGVNGFTGTTGVSSAPGNSFSMLGSATGFLAGRFFGPAAQELGAVWNLYDGARIAGGVLVAKQ